ncbi:ThuA domain-containing protein [Verrucomicrobiaceae bacterium 5K15]|uniref:ThuA domain-containing protein n=1 Tax=Oceaniferula flava TaxID=2800421 RepID=A0AAE2SFC3_9BACT|nr:ThuA domain-containing protein [Oceaniferula flavus]MBK1855962.1 ThuA domain-containing protein [Oceaniferula flavus]MBM1137269.1 ThuA domain-containing protein [Oceaniferula flavus]
MNPHQVLRRFLSGIAPIVALLVGSFTSVVAKESPHAVLIAGTHHYSPHVSMPKFAAELDRLGFTTTVVNPDWDPEKDKRGLPGLEALERADVAVFFIRFLKLEEAQLKHIMDYVRAGKPVVCLRTSTHGFNYQKDHPRQDLNMSFGRDVFGTPYQIHLKGGTTIQVAKGAEKHPILTGVDLANWKSPGTLYLVKPQPGITPLLMGTGRSGKVGKKSNQFGSFDLKEEMTDVVAWTWKNKWNGRTFTTSLGHMGDFAVAQSMRVMVNGVFWAAGEQAPAAETEIRTLQFKGAKQKKKPAR